MSKLWIVHRNPRVRAALGRATGLLAAVRASGAPELADFPASPPPRAVLIGLEGDCQLELDFVRALAARDRSVRFLLACTAGEAEHFTRSVGRIAASPTVVGFPPDPARLRVALRDALAGAPDVPDSDGASDSLLASAGEGRERDRLAARFDAWLGQADIVGLEGALDPAWRALPLLVRGRPGSGRSLLLAHAEHERRAAATPIRVDGDQVTSVAELVERIAASQRAGARGPSVDGQAAHVTVWIDAVDALPAAAQRALADWIRHGFAVGDPSTEAGVATSAASRAARPIRWLATAGPSGLDDRLEPALAQAFVPLTLEVPPLARAAGEIDHIAAAIAREWAEQVGGEPSAFAPSAIEALAAEPLFLERAELEAILRASLAAARTPRIEAGDLRFPGETETGRVSDPGRTTGPQPAGGEALARFLADLALERDADPSAALTAHTEELLHERAPQPLDAPDESVPSGADPAWRRLARSLAHEIRNPLVSIRTFTELLPEHHADETFRARFKELVGKDVAHIQAVVTRLAQAAEHETLARVPVDVSALIEGLLAERRERIGRGRLVVLSELEREAPRALGDAEALETALAGLIDRALDSLPARGDLFIATRRLARAGDGRPRLRILLRHHDPQASGVGGELDPVNHILEYVLAETIVAGLGGRLTIDPSQGPETLIVIDLPTP
jgi:signal transduction histidine kinase